MAEPKPEEKASDKLLHTEDVVLVYVKGKAVNIVSADPRVIFIREDNHKQ